MALSIEAIPKATTRTEFLTVDYRLFIYEEKMGSKSFDFVDWFVDVILDSGKKTTIPKTLEQLEKWGQGKNSVRTLESAKFFQRVKEPAKLTLKMYPWEEQTSIKALDKVVFFRWYKELYENETYINNLSEIDRNDFYGTIPCRFAGYVKEVIYGSPMTIICYDLLYFIMNTVITKEERRQRSIPYKIIEKYFLGDGLYHKDKISVSDYIKSKITPSNVNSKQDYENKTMLRFSDLLASDKPKIREIKALSKIRPKRTRGLLLKYLSDIFQFNFFSAVANMVDEQGNKHLFAETLWITNRDLETSDKKGYIITEDDIWLNTLKVNETLTDPIRIEIKVRHTDGQKNNFELSYEKGEGEIKKIIRMNATDVTQKEAWQMMDDRYHEYLRDVLQGRIEMWGHFPFQLYHVLAIQFRAKKNGIDILSDKYKLLEKPISAKIPPRIEREFQENGKGEIILDSDKITFRAVQIDSIEEDIIPGIRQKLTLRGAEQ